MQKIYLQRKAGENLIKIRKNKIISLVAIFSLISILITNQSNYAVQAIEQQSAKKVSVGGMPFGIKVFTNGVMVVKLQDVKTESGEICPAKEADIKVNDIITKINSEGIESNEQVSSIIENSDDSPISLEIKRGDKILTKTLTPISDINDKKRAGMWIKDSGAGIGTITYFDSQNNTFAALGHGICDSETNALLPLKKGEIVSATVTSVTKSSNGNPGCINGYFENELLGNVELNCELGVYGTLNSERSGVKEYEVAKKSEIVKGKAMILCTVDENISSEYEVEIISVNPLNKSKSLVVEITDEKLLEKTGGIVQGMSGAPIIQNNKFVGAVTHVFVNETKKGYGVCAEDMIKQQENIISD